MSGSGSLQRLTGSRWRNGTMSYLADILTTLFERSYRHTVEQGADDRPIEALATDLLGSHGEVSGVALARIILDRYAEMDDVQKVAFFRLLARDMTIEPASVRAALDAYEANPSKASYQAFMSAAEPARQEFARRLNQVPGATRLLVAMRADLLRLVHDNPDIEAIDLDFRHLFGSWFNRGFLVLRPLNWESPVNILEKIIAYEAVHAIDSLDDLRYRLQPEDRRCFGFFHPSMPDEPLIFVEVALTRGVPASVDDLLSESREVLSQNAANTAAFYSISNCQVGLAGISFGNSLIKQVVADLSLEMPNLRTFVTLSPIPGLRRWLEQQSMTEAQPAQLVGLAAHYLLNAKLANGAPYDSVARFHLGNGAMIHAINPNADSSEKGQAQSGGVMVNYLYDLSKIVRNHERFAADYTIPASPGVHALAKDPNVTTAE